MYAAIRQVRVAPGKSARQALAASDHIAKLITANHGTELRVAMMVGGDPTIIGFSSLHESLDAYGNFGAAIMADDEFHSHVESSGHLFSEAQDQLWRVRVPPDEQQDFTSITTVQVNLSRIDEAMAFAHESAATIGGITGFTIGLATAVTGDRAALAYVSSPATMAELEEANDKLEASSDYLAIFKRAEGLFAPDRMDSQLWRRVA